ISCSKHVDFDSSNITTYTATVSWQESATATQWIVEYDTLGFTPGTGIATLVTDTTFAISGLNPNTEYEVLIRAFCGVTDTSLALRGSFRTTCLPYSDTLPYIETFEAYPASSSITTSYIDPCWTRWSTSTSTTSVYPYVTSTGSGNKGIYMYNSASFYTVLAMPSFEEPLNTLQLSFRMARVSTSSESPLIVGVMSDPNDITTFDTIAIVSCLLQSTWQNFEIPLSIYEGEGLHVAFLTASGRAAGNYLDDITINVIPQCAVPTNVVASNITGTTADITWDEGNGSAWIIEYGPAGFIPGTGEGTEEAVSATTFSMVDLVPSTGYDVWVRTDCGDDTSYYSLCCSFRTPCAETLPIPFTETFDSYGFGSTVRPECWTYQGYNNNASYPQVSASQHYSGTSSLYMYSYKSSSDTATPWTYLMTPPIDTETYPMNTLQVSFRALATSLGSSYPGTVIIGIVNDTADIRGSFYPIDTIAVTNTYEWQEMEVFLNQYPEDGTGRHILIASAPVLPAGSTSSYLYNYVYVDNLTIELIPECARPSSIAVRDVTDNSVTLEWEDTFESHSAWEVVYDSVGFDIDSIEATQTAITISNITADTVLIPNLTPGVFYDFYVRTDCNGEYSRWRGPLTAAAGTYSMAKTGSDTIYACDMTIYDDGGAFGNYSASCNTTLVIYPSSPDSVISISGSYAGESCCDYLKIYDGVGTSGTQYCNIVGSNDNIGPFVSRSGPITIVYTSDGSGQYSGFELHAQCIEQSDCGFVTDVELQSVAARSAFISWNYASEMPDTPTQFELELEEVGEESNIVIGTLTTTNPYFMIADLEPTTTYNVRVRSICGTDRSPIFGLATFTTRCLLGGEVEVGNGTYTTEELPVSGCYEYSYSQQIYLASEMNGATTITGVSFFLDEGTGDDEREITVYIAHTDSTQFVSSTDYIPDSTMTLVYDDAYEFTEGWNNIMFDDEFDYNGTSNIVIAFDDNTGYYNCSPYFTAHSTQGDMALVGSQDGDDIVVPNDLWTTNYRNNIKFLSPCDEETVVTCLAPNIALVDETVNSFKVIWAQGYNETSWKVEYKLATDTVWTVAAATVTDTFYTISNLTPNTEYNVRVASICGTETLYSGLRTIFTLCAPYTIPFSEGFETWTASSSPEVSIDRCWDRYTNYESQWTIYPYVSTSYAHTGSKAMYMYGSSTYYSMLTLPQLTVPVDSLEVSFYARKSSAAYTVLVGVITDPTDISSFTAIDTISPATNNVWELFEISLGSYTGTDGRIAFVAPSGASTYMYIDDISVDYIPTCPHVRNIDDSITGADYSIIDWTDPSTATAWEIEYGPEGFTPGTGAGTTEIALSHPHTLMNLTPATKYDIYVRGICGAEDTAKWWGSSIMTRACEDAFDYTVYNDTTYTGAYLPMHTYYNYSYTQQIYLPSEVDTLTGGGAEIEINSIAFQYK
ncbi:MAG: fibronectin type III domain-containing protein, partial [Bacteroidales bacterium]|nr:fibronectin type III domain-containing protein [Bacteroidales bacterium]